MIFKRKENLKVILNNKTPNFMVGVVDGRIGYIKEDCSEYAAFLLDDTWLGFDYVISDSNSIKLFDNNSVGSIEIDFQ